MTVNRTYACPGNPEHRSPALRAGHQFSYLHHPNPDEDPVPRYCPKCGLDSEGEEPDLALATPHIGQPIKGVVDNMHRDMEAGAEFRANIAAEQFGLDTAEANGMKLGDMKDGLRQGDTSDIEVKNDITRTMEAAPPGMFGFQSNGIGYSGAVPEGPHPNAGAHAQKAVRAAHARTMGNAGHAGAVTSSLPALETTNPGYKVRVR